MKSDEEPVRTLLWLFLCFIILLPFILVTTYFFLISQKDYIQKNWNYYKEKPYIIPFADFLSPDIENDPNSKNKVYKAVSSFNYVVNKMITQFFKMILKPMLFIFEIILSVIKSIMNAIDMIRKVINNLRNNILQYFQEMIQRFTDAMSTLQFMGIKLNDIMGRLGGLQRMVGYFLIVISNTLEVIMNVIGDIMKAIVYTLIAISILLFWWYPILAAMLGFLAAGCGIAFCFDGDTPIDLYNGKQKKISEIKIGDILTNGNIVEGILIASSINVDMYNYKNIIVSGNHAVFENKWIRIKDSKFSNKINYDSSKKIYCLFTENNLIFSNGIKFLDYNETNNPFLNGKINKLILNSLNNDIDDNEIDINTISASGYQDTTEIKMQNGTYKKIKNIQIGDKTSKGKVTSIVNNVYNDYIYDYNHILCSGENIVYHNNKWVKINNLNLTNKQFKKSIYNITTTSGIVETKYNNVFRDFLEINNPYVLEKIDQFVLKILNKEKRNIKSFHFN